MRQEPVVWALTVTFDAPAYALACVRTLRAQTPSPARILVIDNGTERADLTGFPDVRHIIAPSNLGPAGGFALGFEDFLRGDGTHLWVMDDDVRPDPGCLTAQLATLAGDPRSIVVPNLRDQDGLELPGRLGWAALLVARSAAEQAGSPLAELFWGAEDEEWLLHRCSEVHGIRVVRDEHARAQMHARDLTDPKPPWKYYYEARNVLFVNLYRRPGLGSTVRLKIAAIRLIRLLRRAWREPGTPVRIGHVALGIAHGLVGRLGRTVRPGAVDRPRQ